MVKTVKHASELYMAKRKIIDVWEAKQAEKLVEPEPKKIKYNAVSAKSANQKDYIRSIKENSVTLAIGEPGSGKTCIAVGMAVEALARGEVDRIVVTRPAVEAYERLGFMPGNADEKMSHYIQPIYDELDQFVDKDTIKQWVSEKKLIVVPMGFLRGRNLKGFIILDESQNCSMEQLKLFLTRLCPGAKMVLTGDPRQSDLHPNLQGGFARLASALKNIPDIGVVYLDKSDIVRHKLVPVICEVIENLSKPRSLGEFWTGDYSEDIGGW